MIPPRVLTPTTLSFEPLAAPKVFITEDVYFVGFPYGRYADEGGHLFGPRPLPLAKRGILSAAVVGGAIEVDALNNPGFSGAPILARDASKRGDEPTLYVLGVVQGYLPELVHVTTPIPTRPGEDLSKVERWRIRDNGRIVLRDTPQLVPLNSGILTGYTIDAALEVIRQHSIGPEVPEQ